MNDGVGHLFLLLVVDQTTNEPPPKSTAPTVGLIGALEEIEQAADLLSVLRVVAEHLRVPNDDVAVTPSVALAQNEAALDEVGDDPLGGADRHPEAGCDVAQPQLGIAGERSSTWVWLVTNCQPRA